MADGVIASAVALSEPDESPNSGLKRRQSSVDNNESKRRRLSTDDRHPEPKEHHPSSATTVTPPKGASNTTNERENRRKSGVAEERKRGQRLFGSLLGTLSQSSSTVAQKRRADIEKKQQAKLRIQDEEYNELSRKKREDILEERRKAQRVYDKQAMRLRHSNELAMANFLKTTTEPVLYYKPWQLLPGEEDRIKKQIEDCKAKVAREVEDFEAKNPTPPPPTPKKADGTQATTANETSPTVVPADGMRLDAQEPKDQVQVKSDTVGSDTNNDNDRHEHEPEPEPPSTKIETETPSYPLTTATAPSDAPTSVAAASTNETSTPPTTETHDDKPPAASPSHQKAPEDDSGEVMLEDKEDTVIY
ncbi:hypothetical protein AJ79_02432 [Helicocarpus griseus UAMH5409]|uniref:Pinin/SDK/MemA protein domain-containing protein n=1 Tax=Helicocarpus griseus UAMH5409 TaxID=1447875 RepID=A0A2B7Y2P1_9EURO|nr:hypothetical protein AJ79_02432 [Helicocarpus griseus UAMH5409]